MKDILKYYSEDGTLKIFDKYMLYHFGFIRNRKTGEVLQNIKKGVYNTVSIYDNDGNTTTITIGRAIASTFIGPPPSLEHTADHINQNADDDNIHNIRWATNYEQKNNRNMPKTYKSAFIIVKDGIEKSSKEWVEHLKDQKNTFGREYTEALINVYARRKQHGFSYKEYMDLPDEIWKMISNSKTSKGYWMISDMNRIKYVTKHAINILSGERFFLEKGYPSFGFNKKNWKCHILSFMTFFPDEYAAKKPEEMVLHEDDDKLDFRPHKLRLGTQSDNNIDAYNNGCYDDTKSARMKCASYVNGEFEKEHESQYDAAKYLKTIDIKYKKAQQSNISMALNGNRKTAYDRTWELI